MENRAKIFWFMTFHELDILHYLVLKNMMPFKYLISQESDITYVFSIML